MIVDVLIQGILLLGALVLSLVAGLETAGFCHVDWQGKVVVSLVMILIVKTAYFRMRDDIQYAHLGRRLGWFYGLILLLQLVYYLNPSHAWVMGSGLVPVDHLGWLPSSADQEGTLDSLVFACGGMSMLAAGTLLHRKCMKGLMHVFIAAAAVIAILVILQRMDDRPFPVFPVTGIFVSENHYAAFANFNIALLLALGSRGVLAAFLYLPFTLLLGTSIVLSGSRAGLLIMLITPVMFCASYLVMRMRRARPDARRIFSNYLNGVLILLVVGLVLLAALTKPRVFSTLSGDLAYRGITIRDTLFMWLDQPWWGTGPGSFARAFPYYQSTETADRFFDHAHSDPVQFLAEYGMLGVAIIAVLMLRLALGAGSYLRASVEGDKLVFGWFTALVGCAVHSLVDFTFRQELIALMCLAALGIIIRSGYDTVKPHIKSVA